MIIEREVARIHSKLAWEKQMSGHSKWATTKHKKAIIDAKRSKIFTKVAKLLTIAVRDGKSGDPNSNPTLRMAIENARAVSMPKDNIDRAIKRGIGGEDGGLRIEEVNYEAYAPGGIALLIECLTDNKNRALAEVKANLNKAGGSMASAGSVSYLFRKVGQIIIDSSKSGKSSEELEEVIIESGASDFSNQDGTFLITTEIKDLNSVADYFKTIGIDIESAEIVQVPNSTIEISDNQEESLLKLLDNLDELDDVNNVYTNANI